MPFILLSVIILVLLLSFAKATVKGNDDPYAKLLLGASAILIWTLGYMSCLFR